MNSGLHSEPYQGLLKRIQGVVPGFRLYRNLEDLRYSDQLVRARVARELEGHSRALKELRTGSATDSDALDWLGSVIAKLEDVISTIQSQSLGYSGIDPNRRVRQPELDALCQADLDLYDSASRIAPLIVGDFDATRKNDTMIKTILHEMQRALARREQMTEV